MRVIFYDTADRPAHGNARRMRVAGRAARAVADVVSLHVDGRPGNAGFFGAEQFAVMKPRAMFINASRGMVVDDDALRDHILSGHIAGAAIDVFPVEPKAQGDAFESRAARPRQRHPHPARRRLDPGGAGGDRLVRRRASSPASPTRAAPRCRSTCPRWSRRRWRPVHRMGFLHDNVPGVLAEVNALLAEAGDNVIGQHLVDPRASTATSSPTPPTSSPKDRSSGSAPPSTAAGSAPGSRDPRGPIGCRGEPPAGRGAAGGGGRPPRLLHLEPRAPARLRDRRAARRSSSTTPRRSRTCCRSPTWCSRPGPGHPADPADFAVGTEVSAPRSVPVLGVCLGMQGLVTAYGGLVDRVTPAHGEVAAGDPRRHRPVRRACPSPFAAVRYHSLAATRVPDELAVTARCRRGRAEVVMGGAAHQTAAARRAVPPRVDPVASTARRWSRTSWRSRDRPGRAVRRDRRRARALLLARRRRRPRLVGPPLALGWLDDDDVSLTLDAARGEVRPPRGGRTEVVGDDVFAALEAEIGRRRPGRALGRLLRLRQSRPDLPACVDPADPMPDRGLDAGPPRATSSSTEPALADRAGVARGPRRRASETPEGYAAAFADVQEQLRAGNSYEVNLTYRLTCAATSTRSRPTSGCATSTPRRTPGSCSTGGRWLLSSSPERYADHRPAPAARDQADQGHHPARRHARTRTRGCASGWPPTRSSAPRT